LHHNTKKKLAQKMACPCNKTNALIAGGAIAAAVVAYKLLGSSKCCNGDLPPCPPGKERYLLFGKNGELLIVLILKKSKNIILL
jgi:hypothetical protein